MTRQTDEKDVEKIIIEYRPRLKSFIRKRVSNKEDAEDILQDVFFQLIKAIEGPFKPIEQVAAWLYRVTRNTIINRGRKKREEEFPVSQYNDGEGVLKEFSEILFGDDSTATPETEYLRTLVWQELEAALAGLPPEQREAFELIELEGLPVKEIAESIDVPVNTLLSRKHYAVKHLRKRLDGLYKDLLYY